ncbi:MAG: hypothetical protein M1832_004860 [Thelocarpon impressellum]|nr:MAG: hypothetical protein M1832_004860 [Thelocarpon impressellum]
MDAVATKPVVPTPSPTPDPASRRRSLPPPSDKHKAASANKVRVQPASPEVISSLISSLSTISSSKEEQPENVPPTLLPNRSRPASPGAADQKFPPLPSDGLDLVNGSDGAKSSSEAAQTKGEGFGVGFGAYTAKEPERDHLYPGHHAVPPAVRATKSPSASSPLAPRRDSEPDGHAMITSYWRGTRKGEQDDRSSIGSVSVEPGVAPPDLSTRRGSASTDGKKSRRNQFGLMYMNSKERLRELDGERRRPSLNGGDGLGLNGLEVSHMSAFEPFMAESTINEELELPKFSLLESGPNSGSNSPAVHSTNSSPGIGGGRFIPVRESSLRKTSYSPSRSKRRSHHSGAHESSVGSEHRTGDHSRRASTVDDAAAGPATEAKAGIAERRKSKRYPANLVTGELHNPSSILYTSPAVASARAATAATWAGQTSPFTRRGSAVETVGDSSAGEDESAPSPAIVQRRPRDGTPRPVLATSLSDRPAAKRSASAAATPTAADWSSPGSAPLPSRRNSRLLQKRRPDPPPTSPKSANPHRRTFSIPLGRNSESTARPATIVVDDRPSSADSIDNAVDAYLTSPRLSQKITHPQTGRVISFSEVGDPDGFAVFCCVGMGLTRYITAFYDELALSLKLRLITPDRPGVGDGEAHADGTGTPLGWPDDVYAICQVLKVGKFSILAHSAGAIYALATALRMPQHIRGRIHLLAPWIPPSQMSVIGMQESPPAGAVPTSQRILRALPTPVLKVANSSFMSATSSSITSSLPKSPRRKRKPGRDASAPAPGREAKDGELVLPTDSELSSNPSPPAMASVEGGTAQTLSTRERQATYDGRLTSSIWALATANANPAVDLLVCLERRQPIGFRYVDITRAVVIHHGSRDSRVPVENVRWLAKTMRRCEVRVLEGEGHGLMASAVVMGGVLTEIAREWEDWMEIVNNGRNVGSGRKSEWGL